MSTFRNSVGTLSLFVGCRSKDLGNGNLLTQLEKIANDLIGILAEIWNADLEMALKEVGSVISDPESPAN